MLEPPLQHQVLINAASSPVDATPCNALIRQCFPRRSDLFGRTWSKPCQGSVPADLTLASDLAFVFKASWDRHECCVDPLRPPGVSPAPPIRKHGSAVQPLPGAADNDVQEHPHCCDIEKIMPVKKMRLTYVIILAEPTSSHHEANSYRNKCCIVITIIFPLCVGHGVPPSCDSP